MKHVLNIKILAIAVLVLNIVVGLGFSLTQSPSQEPEASHEDGQADEEKAPSLALLTESKAHAEQISDEPNLAATPSLAVQPGKKVNPPDQQPTEAENIAVAMQNEKIPEQLDMTVNLSGEPSKEAAIKEKVDEMVPEMLVQCFEVGPFRDPSVSNKLMEEFRSLNIPVSVLKDDPGELLGHWVYLRPERSLALARLKLEEIKLKGIKDVALVKNVEPLNAISLGVYRSQLTAQKRFQQIQKMGYEPELALRYKRAPETWLLVETNGDTLPTDAGWTVLLSPAKDAKYKPSDC